MVSIEDRDSVGEEALVGWGERGSVLAYAGGLPLVWPSGTAPCTGSLVPWYAHCCSSDSERIMVLSIKARWSLGSIPRSLLSPLSTSKTSTAAWMVDKVGSKASVICTGRRGTAR